MPCSSTLNKYYLKTDKIDTIIKLLKAPIYICCEIKPVSRINNSSTGGSSFIFIANHKKCQLLADIGADSPSTCFAPFNLQLQLTVCEFKLNASTHFCNFSELIWYFL